MKKLINLFIHKLKSCPICYGTGQIEKPNGEATDCRNCKGKGVI